MQPSLPRHLQKRNVRLRLLAFRFSFYGDLKSQFVEANVGFDTICNVNSQLVSNKCIDALSAEKCMRNGIIYFSAGNWLSYVSQIQDTLFISMEILLSEDNGLADIMQELERLINAIVDVLGPELVADKYHGVILLPEGLIESIPEVYALLQGLAVMIFSFDEVSNKVVYAGVPNNRLKDGFGVL